MERQALNFDNLAQIEIDFSDSGYPSRARKLQPKVYKQGNTYCCIYGPDSAVGIFGYGNTPLEAIEEWEKDLQHRLDKLIDSDNTAHQANHSLNQL